MGNIPLVTAREGARTAIKEVRGAMSSPDDFGASIGKATQQLGASLGSAASTASTLINEDITKKRNEAVANGVAQDRALIDQAGLEAQKTAPADGGGMATVDKTYSDQVAIIDKQANERFPNDPEARQKYKNEQLASAGAWKSKQVGFVYTQDATNARTQANQGLDATINRTRTDPSTYDENIVDAEKLIDANTSIPAASKDAMKIEFRSKLGEARFSSGLTAARSTDDFDKLEAEAKTPKFQNSMSPQTYDRVLDAIKASKSQFMTAEGAKANGILSTMEARSKDQVIIPDAEMSDMAAMAKNAKSPAVATRFQEVYQQQSDLKLYGKATPEQLREKQKQLRAQGDAVPNEPGTLGSLINTAAAGAGVPPSIIQAVFGNEYSAKAAASGDLNRPNVAGASSARGMFQMIDGTFVEQVRKNPGVFGDQSDRSDAQILKMRDNPENQAKAMGTFTKANVAALQNAGVAITAPNVYMLHFLGQKGGMQFLRALATDPTSDARSAVDFSSVSANASVFLKPNGDARTVSEVYDMFANKMARNQGLSATQYNRAQYFNGMADAKEKALKNDPMTQARADAVVPTTQLKDINSFAARGMEATAAATYYHLPPADMKPFTADEAMDLSRRLKQGTTDDKLAILAQVQAMDKSAPGMATAALKQLGEEDTTTGHAAGLFYSGRTEDAAKIMRGSDRIANDKTLGDALGSKGDAEREFNTVVGLGLNGVKPEQRMAIFNAAKGHYIESNPGVNTNFNSSAFRKSVKAVMGGENSVTAINGEPTIVPSGVAPDKFERAIEGAFNDQDYARMSVSGQPPKYGDGTPVLARDIAYEGKLRWNGAGVYNVEMSDGKFLVTGETDTMGNALKYRFRPSKEDVDSAIARADTPRPSADVVGSGEMQAARLPGTVKPANPADPQPGEPAYPLPTPIRGMPGDKRK